MILATYGMICQQDKYLCTVPRLIKTCEQVRNMSLQGLQTFTKILLDNAQSLDETSTAASEGEGIASQSNSQVLSMLLNMRKSIRLDDCMLISRKQCNPVLQSFLSNARLFKHKGKGICLHYWRPY